MQLTLNRLVRYVMGPEEARKLRPGPLSSDDSSEEQSLILSAIVTQVIDKDTAALAILPPPSSKLPAVIQLDARKQAWPPQEGHWHWPPEFMGMFHDGSKKKKASNGKSDSKNHKRREPVKVSDKLPVKRSTPVPA